VINMEVNNKTQILLTNDDGIQSPGLWAAAEALSSLGYVTVAAPLEQSSGMGRSLPITSPGTIHPTQLKIGDREWTAYAVGGTPAQAVQYAVFEIMAQPPDLVVSGINYGENVGNSITISGTVGAALEAASFGIPAVAISLQSAIKNHFIHSRAVDFSTAAHFSAFFSKIMLEKQMHADVQILKVDVPDDADPQTGWRVTRMGQHRYYLPTVHRSGSWEEKGEISVEVGLDLDVISRDSDIYTLAVDRMVSVTPISLDMTSRVDLSALEGTLRSNTG
jgi:5'-nucleotidase